MLDSFKNFETLIRKRRTLGEPFDIVQTQATNVIEVNHWAKVANETAHINEKKPQFIHIKNSKYQKVDTTQQYIDP